MASVYFLVLLALVLVTQFNITGAMPFVEFVIETTPSLAGRKAPLSVHSVCVSTVAVENVRCVAVYLFVGQTDGRFLQCHDVMVLFVVIAHFDYFRAVNHGEAML